MRKTAGVRGGGTPGRRRLASAAGTVRRRVAGVVVVALVATVVVAGAGRSGDRAAGLALGPGTAWFGAARSGAAVLIDGATATKVATVGLQAKPTAVVQGPSVRPDPAAKRPTPAAGSAYVAVEGAHLRRLDGSSAAPSLGAEIDFRPGDQALVAGGRLWTVAAGAHRAQLRDPSTLDTLGPAVSLPGTATSFAGTADGRLWVAGGDEVRSLAVGAGGGRSRSRTRLAGMKAAAVVVAGGSVVAVDPTTSRAVVLDAGTGAPRQPACLDADASAAVSGAGDGPWLLAVWAGGLMVSDVRGGAGACRSAPLPAGSPGRYGPAVERRGKVYVADHDEGVVLAFVAADLAVAPQRIDVGLPGRPFVLSATQGHVWFDDPDGDVAGVITDDGRALAVAKQDPAPHQERPGTQGGTPVVGCAGPAQALRSVPTTLVGTFATAAEPSAWVWSAPGASPPAGTGRRFDTTWATLGPKQVALRAEGPGGPYTATCTVEVVTHLDLPKPPKGPTVPVLPEPGPPATTPPPPRPPLEARFTHTPDPGTAGDVVTFADATTGEHRVLRWDFQGASPATATGSQPSVRWATPGTYTVTLTVEHDGAAASASEQVAVAPPGGLAVTTALLPRGTVSVAYRQSLEAIGGMPSTDPGHPPYTWTVASGTVPAGITVNSDGTVSGTPASSGSGDFVVTVTDSAGQRASRKLTLPVRPSGRVRMWGSQSPLDPLQPWMPVDVGGLGPESGVISAGGSDQFRAVALDNGAVMAWGLFYDQESKKAIYQQQPTATKAFPPGSAITQVWKGRYLDGGDTRPLFALDSNGKVWELAGDPTSAGAVDVTPPAKQVVDIESGAWLLADGTVWGVDGLSDVVSVAAMGYTQFSSPPGDPPQHFIALHSDGTVSDVLSGTPPRTVPGLSGVELIACGDACYATTHSGAIYAWGRNDGGALGDGTLISRTDPGLVTGFEGGGRRVVSIAASTYALAVLDDGSTYGWGLNYHSQLGNPNPPKPKKPFYYEPLPVPIEGLGVGSGVWKVVALARNCFAIG
ncbi:MAG TPA: putative Ig domain-containing protein [Acidimicrobiales bacterium]|nr:putative Ig domain-containing protein [Acidimicrobiales bacterium]